MWCYNIFFIKLVALSVCRSVCLSVHSQFLCLLCSFSSPPPMQLPLQTPSLLVSTPLPYYYSIPPLGPPASSLLIHKPKSPTYCPPIPGNEVWLTIVHYLQIFKKNTISINHDFNHIDMILICFRHPYGRPTLNPIGRRKLYVILLNILHFSALTFLWNTSQVNKINVYVTQLFP